MGACSSIEVIGDRPGLVMQPLPSFPTPQPHPHTATALPSTSPAVAHYSPTLSPSPTSNLTPPSHTSRLEPIDRPNRHSASAVSAISSSTLRLASLTLDGDPIDDSAASTASATASPHSAAVEEKRTGQTKVVQARESSAEELRSLAHLDDASPHAGAGRSKAMLNPRRQEKAATADDAEGYSKAVEEEKTQPLSHVVEAKRGSSGLLSKMQRPKKRSPLPLELSGDEKRLTSDSPILIHLAHVSPSSPSSTSPSPPSSPPEPKRLSALFTTSFKKSASVETLSLPPAPPIPTTRLPSEVEILDVIRVLGQPQSVSATTLSQYTRCVPPTLAGPMSRSPRGSWQAGAVVAGGVGCCAKLHCEGCRMDVMMLDHHRWCDAVSAAVFREHYPDVQRLRASLVASVGSRAYCCACSWVDVKGPVAVEEAVEGEERRLQWVCAGHQ